MFNGENYTHFTVPINPINPGLVMIRPSGIRWPQLSSHSIHWDFLFLSFSQCLILFYSARRQFKSRALAHKFCRWKVHTPISKSAQKVVHPARSRDRPLSMRVVLGSLALSLFSLARARMETPQRKWPASAAAARRPKQNNTLKIANHSRRYFQWCVFFFDVCTCVGKCIRLSKYLTQFRIRALALTARPLIESN